MRTTILLFLSLSLFACQSAPTGPPEEVAGEILLAIESDQPARARDLFDRSGADSRESMYPILFSAAQERYERSDSTGAVELLRFMAERYPEGSSVRQALLYGLMVRRARQDVATVEEVSETDEILKSLRAGSATLPLWVDLVEAQQRIDQDRLPEARQAFDRFLAAWDGQPVELMVYVEDIDRYLTSH
jgi:hypothetical protein